MVSEPTLANGDGLAAVATAGVVGVAGGAGVLFADLAVAALSFADALGAAAPVLAWSRAFMACTLAVESVESMRD